MLRHDLDSLIHSHALNGSVIIRRGGETLWAEGYGWADADKQVPNTPQTRFGIGSVTKQFTAMAIMILQEQGKLDVDAPLSQYLDDIPDTWKPLTLHQILTHTSGLMHSWQLPGFAETMHEPATLEETIDRFKGQPLLSPPGTQFAYSGLGYFILAHLIEELSGQSYEQFLKEAVFEPLGMKNAGALHPALNMSGFANGYARQDNSLQPAAAIYFPILTGGGNLYASVEDMARWDQGLTDQKLISAASYQVMYTPEQREFAYGWVVSEQDGRQIIFHSGGVPGYNAFILRYPVEELSVIVLSNAAPTSVGQVAFQLAARVLSEEES